MPGGNSKNVYEQSQKFYNTLHKGMIVTGKVKNIQPYGVFVELQKGIVGLLHIEDISVSRIRSPKDYFKIGDTVKAKVKNYDKNTGRITLNCKDLFGTWEENVKDFPEKTVAKGIIRNIESSGIFVELRPNLVGLAENKKQSVSYGDEVNVFIKKIAPETRKIKLVILD